MNNYTKTDKPQPKCGLKCRGCGCGHFHLLYTRRTRGGRLIRRRQCRHCGRMVTAYEKVAG